MPSRSSCHFSGPALALLLAPLQAEEAAESRAREFADRWVEWTRKGGEGVESFFREDAVLGFEAAGRKRESTPAHYGPLLARALKDLKRFERVREDVELDEGEDGRTCLVKFRVLDRLQTSDGFTVEVEAQEEFDFPTGNLTRANRYRSRNISSQTVETPEPWMTYGGPQGLNGHLIEAQFYAAPEGMGIYVAGAVVSIVLLLKVIYSLGIKRRL